MMKTRLSLVFPALMLFAGCGTEQLDNEEVTPVDGVAISVGHSVQGLTRAAVVDGSQVTATVVMCDGDDPSDWSSFTKVDQNTLDGSNMLTGRATVSTASFQAGTAQAMALNPVLYYNTTTSVKSFLAAVSPAGALTGTSVSFSMKDGLQDVMYAAAQSAGSSSSQSAVNFSFEHLTTQLGFAVALQSVGDDTGQWFGKTVSLKSLSVQNVRFPESVNASTGTVTWTDPAVLPLPGMSATALSGSATPVGNSVMVSPGAVVLDVVLTVGSSDLNFYNVAVQSSSNTGLVTQAGKSHLVTLTIEEPKQADGAALVEAKATVKPWEIGEAGHATLN